MVDQKLAPRLPLAWLAVALGIFALLSVSEIWTSVVGNGAFTGERMEIGLAPAAYIGLASVGVACAGAAAARWDEITRPLGVTAAAGQLLTLTLIASFVLPALNVSARSAQGRGHSHLRVRLSRITRLAWTKTGAAARDCRRDRNARRRPAVADPTRLRAVAVRALAPARMRCGIAGARSRRQLGSTAPAVERLRARDRGGERPLARVAVPPLAIVLRRGQPLLLAARLVDYQACRRVRARPAPGFRLDGTLRP